MPPGMPFGVAETALIFLSKQRPCSLGQFKQPNSSQVRAKFQSRWLEIQFRWPDFECSAIHLNHSRNHSYRLGYHHEHCKEGLDAALPQKAHDTPGPPKRCKCLERPDYASVEVRVLRPSMRVETERATRVEATWATVE